MFYLGRRLNQFAAEQTEADTHTLDTIQFWNVCFVEQLALTLFVA